MPLWLLANWKLIVGAVALVAACYLTQRITAKIYEGDIAALRLDYEGKAAAADKKAANLLQEKTEEKNAIEQQFSAFKDLVEKQHAEQQQKIDGLRIANGRLVAAAGGLFDKNGRPSGGPGGGNTVSRDPAAAGSATTSAAGCNLSDQVTSDLLDLAHDADLAAIYAQAGHAYAVGLPAAAIAPPH